MKMIMINGLTIEIERKRIKNMYLKVLPPEGQVRITAPIRMSEDEIRSFVIAKLNWIELQQKKLRNRHTHEELGYVSGEVIFIWGQQYILEVIEKSGRPRISLEGDRLMLAISADSTKEERKHRIDAWFREQLDEQLPLLIAKWETIIGVSSTGYSIRDMKTRWGTCNIRTKKICLSLQLAKKHPRCLEYVVVHELVHLLEKSHNHVFKAYLDQFLPDWRSIRKEMNGIV